MPSEASRSGAPQKISQRLFRAWASDSVHLRDAHGTERLGRLREIADDAQLPLRPRCRVHLA